MDRRDQELLDKQMGRLTPPRNEGAICCDARRDVFSWHGPRQRPVSAPKCADTNRIVGLVELKVPNIADVFRVFCSDFRFRHEHRAYSRPGPGSAERYRRQARECPDISGALVAHPRG